MPLPPGFGAIWITVAIDLVGFGVVLPILPRYAEDLKVSPTVIGLVVGSFSLAQLVFSPFLGRLSDRYGRKPVLLFSLVGTAVGSLLTGLAGSVSLLLLGRLVDGASGASVSVAQAAVSDVASPDQRPRLMGLLGAAFGVGFVVGPAIGTLAALGGPHVPFFVAAAIAGLNALLAVRRLPETHPDRSSASTALVAPPAATDPPGSTPSPEPTAAPVGARTAGGGAVETPAVVDRGGRRAGDRGPGGLGPAAVRLIVVAFVGLLAFSGFEATFALLLSDRLGLTLSSTGAVFTVIGLVLVAVQGGLVHPVSSRLGETPTLRAGLACNAVGLALLALDGGWATLVPSLVLLVVGQGLVTPVVSSALAGQVEARQRGRVLGLQQSAGSLARFVGPFAAGALYQHLGVPSPYLVGAALVALALALLPRVSKVAPEPAAA